MLKICANFSKFYYLRVLGIIRKVNNMSKIITTDNGQRYQTPGFGRTAGAVYAGTLANSLVAVGASTAIGIPCIRQMQKASQACDTVAIRSAIENAMQTTGLNDKGVRVIDVKTPTSSGTLFENLSKLFTREKTLEELHPENKKLVDALNNAMSAFERESILGKAQAEYFIKMFEYGDNACFLPKGNKIIVNIEKLGSSAFHEMGHAINRNMSTFWKGMQKLRMPMMITSGALSLLALCKRPKAEGEQPKNGFDKATTFIKNNVGKLVTLSFVPIIAEELKATSRGNKLAKQLLSPEIAKKVKTTNRYGAISYVATAVISGFSAFVANKVRDKIAHPKEV